MSTKTTFALSAIASTLAVGVMLAAPVAQAQSFQQGGGGGGVRSGGGHSPVGGKTSHFSHSCAGGFINNGQNTLSGGDTRNPYGASWTDWYRCQTPVLKCPAQVQANGLHSHVTPRVEIQQVGGNPDGSTASFRVKYLCDYDYVTLPTG